MRQIVACRPTRALGAHMVMELRYKDGTATDLEVRALPRLAVVWVAVIVYSRIRLREELNR